MKIKSSLLVAAALGSLCPGANLAFGQTWTPTSAPTGSWRSVASSADGTTLVAANLGYRGDWVYTSTNSGVTWRVATGLVVNTYLTNWSVACSSDGTKMVAAASGPIYRSTDSGATWTKTSAPELGWTSIASSAEGSKLVALASQGGPCYCGGVYTSTDSGATWVRNGEPFSVNAFAFGSRVVSSADGTTLAAVSWDKISVSTNSGANWTATVVPNADLNSLASSRDGSRLVVGGYISSPCSCGVIYSSTNSGASWVSNSLPHQLHPSALASAADGVKLLATAGNSGIYTSTNSGASWTSNNVPPESWGLAAISADGSKAVAIGSGRIYISSATAAIIYTQPASQTVVAGASVTWSVGASGADPLDFQWYLNGASVWGGTNATLTVTNVQLSDSGSRYSVRVANRFGSAFSTDAGLTVPPLLVATEPASGIVVTGAVFHGSVTSGSSGTTVWFEWGGDTNYGQVTPPVNPATGSSSLSFTSSVSSLLPGTVYHYRALASNIIGSVAGADASFLTPGWPLAQTGAPYGDWASVASSADGSKLVAAANRGLAIYTSTNSGATWTLTGAPRTNWSSVASSADGTRLVAVTGVLGWTCQGSAYRPPGPIYTSTNAGATWMATLAPIMYWRSVASSADGRRLVAVEESANIYTSTDAGATWTSNSVPGAIWSSVVSSADGIKLLAADSSIGNGGIHLSTNAGVSWTKSSAPITGWRSTAGSADGTKLVAGSEDSFLYTSMDGGVTWARATNGPTSCWRSLGCSADGNNLAAASGYYGINTSTDHGATWVPRGPNSRFSSIASSADGNHLVATEESGGVYTLQSTPTPLLRLVRPSGDLVLSWIVPSRPFSLQENSDLTTTNWTTVRTTPTLHLTNLQNQVIVSPPAGRRFYRLER